jgi:indolepyruvate ferredoxin oxidoreductase
VTGRATCCSRPTRWWRCRRTRRCSATRAHGGVVNTHMTPVADFVRSATSTSVPRGDGDAAGATCGRHFHDFTPRGLAVAGDEIASNILMLGFAWQKGSSSLARVHRGGDPPQQGGVEANLGRLRLGPGPWRRTRRACRAATPAAVARDDRGDRGASAGHLTAYQNGRLAERYAAWSAGGRGRGGSDRAWRPIVARRPLTRASVPRTNTRSRALHRAGVRKGSRSLRGDARIALTSCRRPRRGTRRERPPTARVRAPDVSGPRALARMRTLRGTRSTPSAARAERRPRRP